MGNDINISICVPAFNEEESLEGAVEDLLTTLSPVIRGLEIIIVNDGSTDSTFRIAEQLASRHIQVKVIHHKRNSGIGVCYRNALAIARGSYFTWFPSDHENSATEFLQCLPYLKEKTIVTCYHREQDPRSALRRWISRSYTFILNKYFHLDLKFYNGLTIFPVTLLRSLVLVAKGFVSVAESLIRAIQSGYQVVELPAPLNNRVGGRSKALTLKSACQIFADLFQIMVLIRRVKF
jgi:glycosyltransferase involved in cell wall biosynthesis